jgi:hypothetical protein
MGLKNKQPEQGGENLISGWLFDRPTGWPLAGLILLLNIDLFI